MGIHSPPLNLRGQLLFPARRGRFGFELRTTDFLRMSSPRVLKLCMTFDFAPAGSKNLT